MNIIIKLLITIALLLLPQLAFAASSKDNWYWLVGLAVINSAVISTILVWKSKKLDTFTTKAVGFGAWFWFLIFIQVMLYGFYVGLTK
ncbi:hypothetical protein [Kangiella sp.]|uniref:hypothetical protein n=1 Tax=Kangiella sp. TaxID=1920245 RepID=UPI0019B0ADD4|nr:hypothetical protein [Kangiella sp.]MBD3653888.1 hypothetical protein [Kangiella sp.]